MLIYYGRAFTMLCCLKCPGRINRRRIVSFGVFLSGRGCRKVLSNTDDTFYILLPLHRVGVVLFKCDKVKGKLAIYSNEDTNRQERNQNKKNLNGQLFLHNHTEDRFTGFGRRH